MMANRTRPECAQTTSRANEKNPDIDQIIRVAIETLTPTPSAPEWATAESLRGVGNGFGGPY